MSRQSSDGEGNEVHTTDDDLNESDAGGLFGSGSEDEKLE